MYIVLNVHGCKLFMHSTPHAIWNIVCNPMGHQWPYGFQRGKNSNDYPTKLCLKKNLNYYAKHCIVLVQFDHITVNCLANSYKYTPLLISLVDQSPPHSYNNLFVGRILWQHSRLVYLGYQRAPCCTLLVVHSCWWTPTLCILLEGWWRWFHLVGDRHPKFPGRNEVVVRSKMDSYFSLQKIIVTHELFQIITVEISEIFKSLVHFFWNLHETTLHHQTATASNLE